MAGELKLICPEGQFCPHGTIQFVYILLIYVVLIITILSIYTVFKQLIEWYVPSREKLKDYIIFALASLSLLIFMAYIGGKYFPRAVEMINITPIYYY